MRRHSWFLTAAVVLFLYGVFCLWQSGKIQEQAEAVPKMTCDQLLRNWPGKGRFVKLTDVQLCSRGYAFRRDMDAAMEMFLPIYSARQGQEPPPRELVLLLQILDDRDRERLLATPDIGELTCEIWTPIAQVDTSVRDVLAAKYPGIRLRNCRVVTVGLHEPTPARAEREWWTGIVSFPLAAATLAGWFWLRRHTARPHQECERAALGSGLPQRIAPAAAAAREPSREDLELT